MGNSVIYRPAYDAEVEYLESTGTQWIDTGIVPDENCGVEVSIATTINDQNKPVFGCETTSQYAYKRYHITPFLDKWFFSNNDIESSSGTYDTTIGTEYVIKYNINGEVVINNSKLVDISVVNVMDIQPLCIAKRGPDSRGMTGYGIYKYKYFKIYDGSTLIRDFIPVRIGSVGYLYDKVTKQLFANKGTGNFILGNDVSNAVIPQQRCVLYFGSQRSVIYERIYEEYEWLISNSDSNGTPYINTLIIPNVGQEISFTFKVFDATTNGNEAGVYNATDSSWSLRVIRCYKNTANNYMILEYNNNNNDYPNHTTMVVYDEFATNKEYECLLTINSATSALGVINNNSKTLVPNSDVTLGSGSHIIFVNGTTNPKWSFKSVGFKKFKISGIIDLIPCKLLQSIPAILDGNGIARQAGECGMWDKVSNRFYGNVASSGTFTVKGPKCYEEYDWLIIPYTSNDANTLPIKSNNFNYKYKFYSFGNIGGVWTSNHKYAYYSNSGRNGIWGVSERTVMYNGKSYELNTEISINCNANGIIMDGELMPNYGSSPYFDHLLITCYTSKGKYALSAVTVDGSVRYVPCKLTHGIPASMDANSISRPAGTCGMWDKVNDKFYGNVASSGTFTVADD